MHVQELKRLGADIEVEGNTAVVKGVAQLDGRERDGDGSARLGEPGAGGARRARHDRRWTASTTSTAATSGSRRSCRGWARRSESQPRTAVKSCFCDRPKLPARDHHRPLQGPHLRRDRAAAEGAGIIARGDPETSRKLILRTNRRDVRLVIVRATDVPTYVQYGAAELGVAGKDVLDEHGGQGLYQPLDLGIARCRMMVAVRAGFDYRSAVKQGARLQGGDQVRADGARALRGEGRARRSDQALRLDGARAAHRARRRDRRPGEQRQHAAREQSRRRWRRSRRSARA